MVILDEDNHDIWVKRMKARMIMKKAWKVTYWDGVEKDWASDEEREKAYMAWQVARDPEEMQAAFAEIVNWVSDAQLSHIDSEDPHVVMTQLDRIHRSRGLGTAVVLKRRFTRLTKSNNETMSAWVGRVKSAAYRLKLRGLTIADTDIIVALTNGLDPSYDSLIVALDSLPEEDLTLMKVVDRMLNEEARRGVGGDADQGTTPLAV